MLLPELDVAGSKPRVFGLVQGSVVQPGQAIPVKLVAADGDSASPDTLAINLYAGADADNLKALASYNPSRDQVLGNRIPALVLPDLPSGSYKLVFRYSGNGTVSRVETITFFVSRDVWAIGNVFAYPGTLLPGGEGLFDLVATVPKGARAWVRWSMGSEVLKSGLADNGHDRLQYRAKTQEGVYTIRVELFPQAPDTGQDYGFKSPIFRELQVVVSRSIQDSLKAQDAEYLFRHHLTGSLQDNGRLAQASSSQGLTLASDGQSVLDTANEVLGYHLGDGGSFTAAKPALPDLGGVFKPIAVYLRVLPLSDGRADLFVSQNRNGSAGVTISRLAGGLIQARAWGAGWEKTIHSGSPAPARQAVEISLGFSRNGKNLQMVLDSSDGAPVSAIVETPAQAARAADASLRLGSAGSGGFILDEFGIYQPDDARLGDWNAFYLVMLRRWGSALRFAEDFMSDTLPGSFSASAEVRSSQGTLIMPPGSSVGIPLAPLDNSSLLMELRFAAVSGDAQASLQVESPEMAPVSISFDGVVRQSGRVAVIPAFSLDPLVCTLSASAKALRLQSADFDFPIAGFIPGKPITLHLVRSAKASGSFALLSILGREPRQASLNLEP